MKNEIPLGKLIEGDAQRDAIHIAVCPMTATHELQAGAHINAKGEPFPPYVGIVDPFLKEWVDVGEKFFCCLYPNTVTSLRHEWTHPGFLPVNEQAFDKTLDEQKVADKAASEKWLREYASRVNSYDSSDAAFDRLLECLRTNEMFYHGSDLHGLYELEEADELKRHAEIYLGFPIDWGRFEFSCSC